MSPTALHARDIDDVLVKLEAVTDEAIAAGDRVGMFAALYWQVTRQVRNGIDDGLFDDADRMNRFDTLFANRYFEALHAWRRDKKPTRSWKVAFEADEERDHAILQHLLLGVNAHVNLDLAIATAAVDTPATLPDLEDDFNRINGILGGVLTSLQDIVNRHSPLMSVLDAVGGRTDEQFVNFNVREARSEAWNHALLLARQDDVADHRTIDVIDRKVSFLARLLRHPGPLLEAALALVRMSESDDVSAIITELAETKIELNP